MKYNKTALLVVVVMILALSVVLVGCPGPAGTGTPDFLEVGGSYWAAFSNGESEDFTVVEIRNDGWILAEDQDLPGLPVWLNTTHMLAIRERPE